MFPHVREKSKEALYYSKYIEILFPQLALYFNDLLMEGSLGGRHLISFNQHAPQTKLWQHHMV